jgi:hypothetical protein
MTETHFHDGRCTCGAVRYRFQGPPLFVHCCHCSWCRRETGSAFVINALVETDRVSVVAGAPALAPVPSASGAGQKIARCPACHTALWSHYAMPRIGDRIAFIRVGTLDDAARVPPDVHIFTASKLPWVVLGDAVTVCPEYYDRKDLWPADSLRRLDRLLAA